MDFKDFKDYEIHNYKKETKWEAFKWEVDWNWNNYLVLPIKRFKTGVKNLWVWRKIIWDFRWWDYSHFMELQKMALTEMYDGWDGAHYVGSEHDQKELLEIINILDRIEFIEDEMPDDLTWAEQEIEIQNLYEEFGKRLYSRRKIKRAKTEHSTHEVETNFIQCLWD